MTLNPQARIAALVGVLLIALAGSAFFLFHGKSQPVTVTPPAHPAHPTHHPTTSPPAHHVVLPAVNPLLPTRVRLALEHSRLVVVGF
jgi:hypothetical protein